MKCLKSILLGVFFASSALAQAPSPTQIGTLKTTNPYPVSILYNNVWYPMGSVNTTLNIFTLPVGNVVNGTTPLLTATNTFANLQTYSSGIAIGGATALVSIKNPSTTSAYNFNLPDSAGAANAPLLSGGGSTNPMSWGTRSGSTTAFATVSGSLTGGNCVSIDSSGNLVDAGGPCSTGGGGGTVTSGQTGELAFYASNGTTVTGNTNAIMTTGKLTLGTAGSSAGSLTLSGAASGAATIAVPSIAGSGTMTLPAATDTIVGKATTDTLTNKTIDTLGPNTIRINGTSLTAVTGTGSVVLATSPTLVTPILGTPTSATLTNATGLPVSTGLSGAGTGVVAALGVATNAANGFPTLGIGGLLAVTKGGTGLGVGVSGGIPYFNTTTTMASSALLTQYGIVYGGGPGGSPVSTSAGTTNYLLTGAGAASPPVFSSISTVLDNNFATAPATPAQGSVIYRGASTWDSLSPALTLGRVLQSGGPSANPTFATISTVLDNNFATAPATPAQGSVIYRGASTWDSLNPAATTGQVLQSGGPSANPAFATISSVLDTNFATPPATTVAQGSVIYRGASNWASLGPAATAGQVLQSGGSAANPSFATISSILDTAFANTQGSILYRGASGWAALSAGVSGQFLKTLGSAANPTWSSVAVGGATYTPAVDAVGVCSVDNTGATDTLSSLNTCLSTYYAISLRPGIYKVSGTIVVGQNNSILGAGYGPIATTSSAPAYNATVIKTTSNTASVMTVGSNALVSGLMVDKYNPDTPATAGCGIDASAGATNTTIKYVWVSNVFRGICLGPSAQGWVQNSVVTNNYSHGVYLNSTSDPTYQWQLQSVLSTYNNGYGFYFTTSVLNTTPGHWFNTSTFANGLGGYYLAATGSGNLNDIGLTQLGAGSDCGAGVTIDIKTGTSNFINGFFVEQSGIGSGLGGCGHISSSGTVAIPGNVTGYGINYLSGSQFTFSEGIFMNNNNAGFNVGASATGDVTVSNSYFWENGNLNTLNPAGIIINGGMRVNLAHNTFTSTYLGNQKNGIVLQGTGATGIITGNTVKNTPTGFGLYSAATTATGLLVMSNDFAGGGTGCSIVAGSTKPSGTSATLNNGSNCP